MEGFGFNGYCSVRSKPPALTGESEFRGCPGDVPSGLVPTGNEMSPTDHRFVTQELYQDLERPMKVQALRSSGKGTARSIVW
jgi:hypothetical protein